MLNLKNLLVYHHYINSFYDQKKKSGAYERLWDLTIISLCSDIEYFFRALFQLKFPDNNFKFGFYQRITEVIEFLEKNGFFFIGIQNDLENLEECFQIRHIATHNMGYVDKKFKENVNTSFEIDERFIVTQDLYKKFYNSYKKLLEKIDDQLS